MSIRHRLSGLCRRIGGAIRAYSPSLLLALAATRGLAADPVLTVVLPGKSIAFTSDEMGGFPHTEISAFDPHEKKEHRYSGVPVHDLLSRVGVQFGEKLRGPSLRLAVILHAKDGYATLFALAEFADEFSDRTLLLADGEDGKPLPPGLGPFRLIAPGDKRAARWARMVTSIEVVQFPQEPAH